MRLTRLIAVPALAAALAVPQAASAVPPDPWECVATIEGVATPADPLGLVATGVVAVAAAQVVCVHDLLDSSVNHLLEPWHGHITMTIKTQSGYTPPGCSHGPEKPDAVGPLLVMNAVQTCTIPVSDLNRLDTLVAYVDWAAADNNGNYKCCQQLSTRLVPVGVGAYTP